MDSDNNPHYPFPTPLELRQWFALHHDSETELWESAYMGSSNMVIPEDFLKALDKVPEARAFYDALDRKNLYPIYYRLQTARIPETRERRLQTIIAMLSRGEKFHE